MGDEKKKQDDFSEKQVTNSYVKAVVTDDIIITDVSIPAVFFPL